MSALWDSLYVLVDAQARSSSAAMSTQFERCMSTQFKRCMGPRLNRCMQHVV
jgi:hypothetical protein